MIEKIPNPMADKGVQREMDEKVREILSWKGHDRNITQLVEKLVTRAAQWGYQTGFRTGWRVHKVTEGGKR